MEQEPGQDLPLAQVEDLEELKNRYRFISGAVLRRWMDVVVGPHHDAMAAILAERNEKET